MDGEGARGLVRVLRHGPESAAAAGRFGLDDGPRLARDMETLKTLRSCIQRDPACVEALAREGVLKVLVDKLAMAPGSNQIYLLQVLASLGYLVQKSTERTTAAIALGAFEAIVNVLRKDSTSEGVLLLGAQVVSFMVSDSDANLRLFVADNGIEACIKVLQRGCVRSSILNARVATLLARICDLFPARSLQVCTQLLGHIRASVMQLQEQAQLSEISRAAAAGGAGSGLGDAKLVRKFLCNTCVTLIQGLGLLLDSKPERTDHLFEAGFITVFLHLLQMRDLLTPHVLETVCYTLTYATANSTVRASALASELDEAVLMSIVATNERLDDSLLHAFATLLSNLVDSLASSELQSDQEAATGTLEALVALLGELGRHSTAPRAPEQPRLKSEVAGARGSGEANVVVDAAQARATHSTVNALRVLRKVAKMGGQALELFIEAEAFQEVITLLKTSGRFPFFVRAELLQEVGLLVENTPRIGLALAKGGACDELKRVIMECKGPTELCNATRALACFVEHSNELGWQITDIALESECEVCLIDVLCGAEDSAAVAHEVLLNTVGALGYMVKRQSAAQTENGELAPHLVRRYKRASAALTKLLAAEGIDESLTWNALWALIYLMGGAAADACTRSVVKAGGVETLSRIVSANPQNQPLVCSASKALWCVLRSASESPVKSLPLEVRLKVLACAARSLPMPAPADGRPGSDAAQFGTIEVTIDTSHIANSSRAVLQGLTAEQLRTNALKIQYISEEVEQAGVDAGGVRRDWLSRLSEQLFNPSFDLVIAGFHPNDSVQISPSPSFAGVSEADQHAWYRLMGRVLGLSVLYEDPLGVALVPSLTKLILEEQPVFEDIKCVSNEYYRTFSRLKHQREVDQKGFEASLRDLTFTVNSRECMMAEAYERDSLPSGSPKRGSAPLSPAIKRNLEALKAEAAQAGADAEAEAEEPPAPVPMPPGRHGAGQQAASTKAEIEAKMQTVKSLKELARMMETARALQDRDLIRRLLQLQNKLLRAKREAQDAPVDAPLCRKRRISSLSTSSDQEHHDQEHGVKRLQTGAAKMRRMMSDLMDGGQMERINAENFDQYLDMLTFKLLVENVASQVAMIKQGFHDVLPRDVVLRLLSADELGRLVEGDRSINVELWKANTVTKGGCEADTPQLRWFWEYATALPRKERQRLLMWATGWRSIGTSGFANRSFTIELTNVTSPAEDERLPSVATCGFHLWLPKYSTKDKLVRKFTLAMSETSFGNC